MAAQSEACYHGTWKIVECVSLAGQVEPTGVEGTVFNLDANGDVSWKVSDDAEPLPFFNCETYQVTSGFRGDPAVLKFFGTYAGHMIEFRVEVSDDLMLLTYERCCMLQCQKVSETASQAVVYYDLLPALEDDHFADVFITTDKKEKIPAHSMILHLIAPHLTWTTTPTPLDHQPAPVILALLHYMYAECLPNTLSIDTANACIDVTTKLGGFDRFKELCETYVRNTALKKQLMDLLSDIHKCLDRIIRLYSDNDTSFSPNLVSNPATLCSVLKNTAREFALGLSHVIMFCDLYCERKGELTREERHEIMKNAIDRLPAMVRQLHTTLSLCNTHMSTIKQSQIHDIATYFVPEIVTVLQEGHQLFIDVRTALDQTISSSIQTVSHKRSDSNVGHLADVLGHTLKHALHMRELKILRKFHEKMSQELYILSLFEQKFNGQSFSERISFTSQSIQQIIDAIPPIMQRLETLSEAKLPWNDWKYLFKITTSKIAWGVGKVRESEVALKPTIERICELVQKEAFKQTLDSLHLLNAEGATCKTTVASGFMQSSEGKNLITPPPVDESRIVSGLLDLLDSGKHTDLTLVIVPPHLTDSETTVAEPVEIHTHCVVMATRCEWFKRALLSGMKEALDRCITIHDTSPVIFKQLVYCLYGHQLHQMNMDMDQLVEFLTLSDRFQVDSLKSECSKLLCQHVTEDTCLHLLSLSEQFNATSLLDCCIEFVVKNNIDLSHIDSIPQKLQTALERQAQEMSKWRCYQHSLGLSDNDDELVSNLNASLHFGSDDTYNQRMDDCLDQLRDITANSFSDATLQEVAVIADFDVNRALNYLFCSDAQTDPVVDLDNSLHDTNVSDASPDTDSSSSTNSLPSSSQNTDKQQSTPPNT